MPLASGIILLPFYTNFLTTEQFGLLALYIAFTAIMQIIVNHGLDSYIGIHYIENKDNIKKIREIIGTSVVLLFFIAVVFLLIFFITGNTLFSYFSGLTKNKTLLEFYPWGFMSLLTAIFNSLFKTYTTLLIYQQRPARFFLLNIFNFVLTIGISLPILLYEPYSLNGPMYGRLLSGLGIFLLALFFFIKEFRLSFHKKLLRGIIVFCYPLLIYFILVWIVGNVDRYIIAYFLNTSDIGIFDFAIKCTFLLEFFQSGLSSSVYPKIFTIWKDQDVRHSTMETNRYFNGFTAITMLIIPVLVIVLPLIIPLVVNNKDYFITFNFLAILFAGYTLSGLRAYFTAPLMYFKKTKALPRVYFFSAIFQVILTIYFIKHFGLMGAVWAFFAVRLLQVVFLYIESRKIFRFTFNTTKQIFLPAFYILLVILSEIFMIEKYRMLTQIIQMIIICTLVLWVYRREISMVAKPVFEKFIGGKDE